MASGARFQFTFGTADGTFTTSLSHADPEAESSDILAAANGYITYSTLFVKRPLTLKTVKMIVTEETDIYPEP